MEKDQNKKPVDDQSDTSVQPDPETLHTTDPQEHMEGPISSLVQKTKEAVKTSETKEEADRKRDEHM